MGPSGSQQFGANGADIATAGGNPVVVDANGASSNDSYSDERVAAVWQSPASISGSIEFSVIPAVVALAATAARGAEQPGQPLQRVDGAEDVVDQLGLGAPGALRLVEGEQIAANPSTISCVSEKNSSLARSPASATYRAPRGRSPNERHGRAGPGRLRLTSPPDG